MAINYSYPQIGALATGDLLTVVDISSGNKTNTLEIGDLSSYIITTSSLINGTGVANNMVMFSDTDTITSAAPVTLVQDGVSTLTIGASNSQDVVYEANLKLQAGLKDSTGAVGSAGQFLSSNGSATVWSSTVLDGSGTSEAIPKWSDADTLTDSVMSETISGITLTGSLSTTLDANIGRDISVTRDGSFDNDVTVGNDITVTGNSVFNTARITATLADASSSVGTSGQVLSSTGTGTSWIDAASSSSPLEWSTQIVQTGTSDPAATTLAVDTLLVGTEVGTPTAYRSVNFLRVGVGTYRILVKWTNATVPTDATKLTLMFGDAVCRVTNLINVSGGSPAMYIWQFETRTPAGVLEDDLLNGSTGGYVNIKLY